MRQIKESHFEEVFDLIIIGGGINGAGTAREAAERGLKVLLLEKNDFGAGCTSHSTRLIHGGLRYLEYLEFPLVYESLAERETLLSNYPNLIHPIELAIPCYNSNRVNKYKLNLGMILYDILSFNKSLDPYKFIPKSKLKTMIGELNPEGLECAVRYFDCQATFVERVCLENILIAQEHGALCLNHCEVNKINCKEINHGLTIDSVEFTNTLDNSKQPYIARGKFIINMGGPWVDQLNSKLSCQGLNIKREIGGTKGSHILVKDFPGGPKQHGVYAETKEDQRPFFILPFKIGSNDTHYLIGTTDIFLGSKDDLNDLKISEEEKTYLLKEVNRLYPKANLNHDSIVRTFCGVRPLPYSDPDSSKPGSVTRRHFIHDHSQKGIENYLSIVGGKITTFRNLSQEIIDLISSKLKKQTSSISVQKSKSRSIASDACDFGGLTYLEFAKQKSTELSQQYDIELITANHMIELYGNNASKVLELCKDNPELKNKLDPNYQDIEAQIVYAIKHENACTVDDIVNRRLSIGLLNENLSPDLIQKVTKHLNQK